MDELGRDYVDSLREALDDLFHGVGDFYRDNGVDPAADSQATIEQAAFPRPQSLVSASSIATFLIESGGEHVSAFVKSITEPMEPIACWTCVRSMLESCALAAWLLEPGIDAHTRVGRVFALRYEGLEQQLKLFRAIDPTGELKASKDHIDCVEQDALKLGYLKVENAQGRRLGIGQRMLTSTEVITLMLDEEIMYRLLSAVTHGHWWAIKTLAFKPVDQPSDLRIGEVPIYNFTKDINMEGLANLGLCAAKAFAKPVWYHCCYAGWDKAQLTTLLDRVFDKLQARRAVRFWLELSS